ncbi:MAG: hypothetical protein ACE5HP_03975 [Gemmatimonadota bacterium]
MKKVRLAAERWERGFIEEAGKVLEVSDLTGREREALNLTRMDDVVESAWFEHRNGRRRMSPAEVRAGAARAPGPDTSRILTVVSGKLEGAQPGFTVEDGRGDRYLIKFDPRGFLGLASSADVITSRLLYAAGYHTPADYIVVFDSRRLKVAPDAEIVVGGVPRRMTPRDAEKILAAADRLPDGRYLALASRFVPGVPKGPFLFKGRRKDDPNDHYRHHYRRELRGLFVLAAWLNHGDLVFQNTMDVWIDPPGYLRHYLIDFGSSLGSGGVASHRPRAEVEHDFAFWPTMARLFTFGFYRVGWEGWEWEVIHPSIGWLPAERYDPSAWKVNWPGQAWRLRTPADAYWGAKLVASFTDAQIRAAVDAAGLEPVAADTLARILIHRRDRTVKHWYGKVTPVEDVTALRTPAASGRFPGAGEDAGGSTRRVPAERNGALRVAFEDLGLEEGLWSPRETRYEWRFRHPALKRESEGRLPAAAGERQILSVGFKDRLEPAEVAVSEREAIATLELTALRSGVGGREAVIYLEWGGPGEGYRVVGLRH